MNAGSTRLLFSRFFNAARCAWSVGLSKMGIVDVRHMPVFISVEPAAICQLKCPECPVGQGNRQPSADRQAYMPRDIWEKVLREAAPYAHTIQFYFQGEPLLNKDLPRMIHEAHQLRLYTIVSTNAQAMTESLAHQLMQAGLSRIIVSMDGLSEESYKAYRIGGSLDKTKQALAWLQSAKLQTGARCVIELQCLKLRSNEHEWEALRRSYKSLGADRLSLKTAQFYDYENGHALMPSQEHDRRYTQGTDGRWHRKPLPQKACPRIWRGVVVTTRGEVLPCCYDKEHAHAYGNLRDYSLRQLFHNQKAGTFRREALTYRHSICQNCWQ